MVHKYLAVDLGASNGRVMLGHLSGDRLVTEEIRRFANSPIRLPDGLHWDLPFLYRAVLEGIALAVGRGDSPTSVGIDSWGVDYGLLDAQGGLLGLPFHYRDSRTDGLIGTVDHAAIYKVTGIQFMSPNTSFQLLASRQSPSLRDASTLLLIPDLLGFLLTGSVGCEYTNATTTQLVDANRRDWARDLIESLGIPFRVFPPICYPGDSVGETLRYVTEAIGLDRPLLVKAVASHDTASAVMAVPTSDPNFAFISSGTWSLVGLELDRPVINSAALAANFSNEGGVDGTFRFLRNVAGLWLLQESINTWQASGMELAFQRLLHEAAGQPGLVSIVDTEDELFFAPGDMPSRIRQFCAVTGQSVPGDAPAMTRCVLDSLAVAYAVALDDAQRLGGVTIDRVHVVGGGSRNALLCQLTSDACRMPVVAGPAEAAAIGNLLVQARDDLGGASLAALRNLVKLSEPLTTYWPRDDNGRWRRAKACLEDLRRATKRSLTPRLPTS